MTLESCWILWFQPLVIVWSGCISRKPGPCRGDSIPCHLRLSGYWECHSGCHSGPACSRIRVYNISQSRVILCLAMPILEWALSVVISTIKLRGARDSLAQPIKWSSSRRQLWQCKVHEQFCSGSTSSSANYSSSSTTWIGLWTSQRVVGQLFSSVHSQLAILDWTSHLVNARIYKSTNLQLSMVWYYFSKPWIILLMSSVILSRNKNLNLI